MDLNTLAPRAAAYITKLSREKAQLEKQVKEMRRYFKTDGVLKTFKTICDELDDTDQELIQARTRINTLLFNLKTMKKIEAKATADNVCLQGSRLMVKRLKKELEELKEENDMLYKRVMKQEA